MCGVCAKEILSEMECQNNQWKHKELIRNQYSTDNMKERHIWEGEKQRNRQNSWRNGESETEGEKKRDNIKKVKIHFQ